MLLPDKCRATLRFLTVIVVGQTRQVIDILLLFSERLIPPDLYRLHGRRICGRYLFRPRLSIGLRQTVVARGARLIADASKDFVEGHLAAALGGTVVLVLRDKRVAQKACELAQHGHSGNSSVPGNISCSSLPVLYRHTIEWGQLSPIGAT
jgi:hypothetical protein